MFCKKCRKQLVDDGLFCPYCGDRIFQEASENNVQPPQQENPPEDLEQQKREIYGIHWRHFMQRPLVLIVTICLTVAFVLTFLSMLSVNSVLSKLENSIPLVPIISIIYTAVSALPVIGCWMLRRASKGSSIKCGGLKVIRVYLVFPTVLVCISALLFLLCLCMIVASPLRSEYGYFPSTFTFALLIMLVMATVQILSIYGISLIIKSAQSCIPDTKMLIFLAVICFISSGYDLLVLLTGYMDFIKLFNAISILITGILLIQYKNCMYSIEYSFMKLTEVPKL